MERTVMVVKPDGMVVEFTASYAINAYHHYRCEFQSRSSEMSVVFTGYSGFLHQ